jgi:hypothetical protein
VCEKRTTAGVGPEARWAAVVRPDNAPDAVNVPEAIDPLAWSARWEGELVGADRSASWMARAVVSMSVFTDRRVAVVDRTRRVRHGLPSSTAGLH